MKFEISKKSVRTSAKYSSSKVARPHNFTGWFCQPRPLHRYYSSSLSYTELALRVTIIICFQHCASAHSFCVRSATLKQHPAVWNPNRGHHANQKWWFFKKVKFISEHLERQIYIILHAEFDEIAPEARFQRFLENLNKCEKSRSGNPTESMW